MRKCNCFGDNQNECNKDNKKCCYNDECYNCNQCLSCNYNIIGATGPQGEAGGVLNFADFYALMPPDNAATIAVGTEVSFLQDGPNSGTEISRITASSFNLWPIGTYQILFQVGVNEAGQLVLTLNDDVLEYTVVGRVTGTEQIVEMGIVTTSTINSVLTVRNPAGNVAALTITPLAGGTLPVSAHLVITQIQ